MNDTEYFATRYFRLKELFSKHELCYVGLFFPPLAAMETVEFSQ